MRRRRAAQALALVAVALVAAVAAAQPAGDGWLAVAQQGVRHDDGHGGGGDGGPIMGISIPDDDLADLEAEALADKEERDGEAEADPEVGAFEDELELRELQLMNGAVSERNVTAALAGLGVLAAVVPWTTAPAPHNASRTRESSREAVGADALFVLAALAHTGVLPAAQVPWDTAWADAALRHAAAARSLEAALAVGDALVHGRPGATPDCDAGLPWLRSAADEVLRGAEAAADHTVPPEPVRLRERVRDGAWASRGRALDDPDAMRWEADQAARGVPEAARHMGYRRLLGRGVPADAAAAAAAFEEAAAAGDEYALFNLGFMRMRGMAGPRDDAAARELFAAAAEHELPAAFNGLGVLSFNGWGTARNYTAARLAFEAGAERGDPDAHFNLGSIHLGGHGVPADAAAALASFEAASEAGHWRAPHQLASLHAAGTGTPRNCSRAARLLTLFAEERLGWSARIDEALEAYDAGDVTGALVRLALLATQGCEAAASNAAFLLRAGKARGLSRAEADARAAALLHFAAARGGEEAYVDLGDMARDAGDMAGAQTQYAAAAAAGVAEGHFALGVLHARGLADGGAPRNLTAARDCFMQAWELAATDEAVLPPALALAALRAFQAAQHVAAACAAVPWDAAERGLLLALTLALAAVMQRLAMRDRRQPRDAAADAPPPPHADDAPPPPPPDE